MDPVRKTEREKALPVIGAAMPIRTLPQHIDWLKAGNRDLELQDACFTPIFDNDWSYLERIPGLNGSVPHTDWQSLVEDARNVLDGYTGRISLHGPFTGLPLLTMDRQIRDVVRRRLDQTLTFAKALGATQVVLHSPWTFFGGPFIPYSTPEEYAIVIEIVSELLAPIIERAEAMKCQLVIEGIFDKNPQPLLDLVRALDSNYVRVSIDTGHAYINHVQGGPPPDQWIRDAGPLLAHMHLQDGDGHVDRHWAPGYGDVNWYALFEALDALSHQPRLILEAKDFRTGAAWLTGRGYVQ
jgi:sugar phosphate isomerase/epimerase